MSPKLTTSSSHSTTTKSKKRKSLVISNPIPCNTAFPTDHVSIHATTQNGKDNAPSPPGQRTESISEETSSREESGVSSKDVNSSDSDLSSAGTNTPKRQSVCDNENSDSVASESQEEVAATAAAEVELATNQSDDSGVGVPKAEAASQEVSSPSDSTESDVPQSSEQEDVSDPPSKEEETKPGPVPTPRHRSTDKCIPAEEQETEAASDNQETAEPGEESDSLNPPGFLYKVHNYAFGIWYALGDRDVQFCWVPAYEWLKANKKKGTEKVGGIPEMKGVLQNTRR